MSGCIDWLRATSENGESSKQQVRARRASWIQRCPFRARARGGARGGVHRTHTDRGMCTKPLSVPYLRPAFHPLSHFASLSIVPSSRATKYEPSGTVAVLPPPVAAATCPVAANMSRLFLGSTPAAPPSAIAPPPVCCGRKPAQRPAAVKGSVPVLAKMAAPTPAPTPKSTRNRGMSRTTLFNFLFQFVTVHVYLG